MPVSELNRGVPVLVAGVVALAVGLLLQPLAIRFLRQRGVMDAPNDRSSHTTPTVRGGGVVVTAALVVGALVASSVRPFDDRTPVVLLLVIALSAAVGFAEDVSGVPVVPRFGLLLLSAAPLAFLLPGGPATRSAGAVLLVFYAVAVINATNFMDGINGISAAQGAAAGVVFAALATAHELADVAVVAAALTGAAVSFAPFNVPRASIFLGDVGSYGLGAAFAGLSAALVIGGVPPEAAVAPLLIYAVDTGATLLRRLRAGEPWHLPHRTHTYQRLTDLGLSHAVVSGLVLALILLCSALGAASLYSLTARVVGDLLLVTVALAYLGLPALLRRRSLA